MGLWKPIRDVDAATQMQRGRVAKLSPPRSDSEFSSVTELIEAVEPSVVKIESKHGIGSGFVLDPSGLIVTCYHCTDGAGDAEIVFANGRRVPILRVASIAPDRDLAIIEITPRERLVPLPLAKRRPKKGEPIVVFGAPAGLSFSVSEGSVSALRTAAELSDLAGVFRNPRALARDVTVVQVTASLMPGNSGGPVVDFSGNVIGISSFLLNWDGQKYEFWISADEIHRLVAEMGDEKLLE
jgi:S1-C subfamily serine protease